MSGNSEAARAKTGALLHARNLERVSAIRAAGRAEARNLINDPFWVAGVVAYWAEGSKRANRLHFSNSDPGMISLFLRWAERYLRAEHDHFTITLHLHDGQDEQERINFWSEVTELPTNHFRKTFIKPEGTGHRKNVLYNGTASIRVSRSTDLLHRALGWIDFLRDRPPNLL